MGGITVEEQAARQQQLHRELTAQLPKGVTIAPILVEIDQQDRDDLAVRFPTATVPLRVGVVKSLPKFVGKPFGKAFNHGVVKKSRSGSFVWAMKVTSPDAQAIRLHFTDVALPANTELYFLGDNGQAYGPYVGLGRNGNGDFWTRSIAKMEWIEGQFIHTCTGGLLVDTDSSTQIPYFLTANHCLTTSISNLETFFNYTTDSCNGSCPDGLVTGGTPPQSNTIGVTVVATGSQADYTLLTLNQAPPAGATFLGWNNTPVANSNGANLYRVSNANFGPQVYSQHDVDSTAGTRTGWNRGPRIYSADQIGATMGGSSGSPVLNSAGEVVGQLSGCGGFNCADECDTASNSTVDGALAFYWGDVAQFLDPPAACTSDAACDDGQFCTGNETYNAGSCQSSGDPCTGGTTGNEGTNSCDTPVCDNDGACEAGEDCGNCPNDCRQKNTGRQNSRYCCDGDLPDCGNASCGTNGWTCGGGAGGCVLDSECDAGQFCNGDETCSGGSCHSGSAPCAGGCDQCLTCGGSRESCSSNSDCCSNNCKRGSPS